jgi:hypothetical protein
MVSDSMCMSWPLHCTHARASHVLKCTLISINLVPNWAFAKRGRGHIRRMRDELKLTSCFVVVALIFQLLLCEELASLRCN